MQPTFVQYLDTTAPIVVADHCYRRVSKKCPPRNVNNNQHLTKQLSQTQLYCIHVNNYPSPAYLHANSQRNTPYLNNGL